MKIERVSDDKAVIALSREEVRVISQAFAETRMAFTDLDTDELDEKDLEIRVGNLAEFSALQDFFRALYRGWKS